MKMPKILTPWGMQVFRAIERRGWDLDKLDEVSGITKTTILRWMQGKSNPRLDMWIVLCDSLAKNEQDFEDIMKATREAMMEYELATRRYRRRAEKQLK